LEKTARLRVPVGVGLLLALSLVLAACGGGAGGGGQGGDAGEGGGNVSGQIAVEGSSTVLPITQAAAEAFSQENPDVRISVGGAGTGDGFEALCAGETQISDASRPIDPKEEIPACEENGIEYIEIPVAYDGISVVVNPQNDFATGITLEELKALWEPEAEGQITRWSQVRSGWPDQEITLYGPGTESGTFDFFTDQVVGEEGASRSDYQASEDDNVLVQGVSGDPNALGYFGFSYYEVNQDKLKALAVDGVEPNTETIRSGEYPLSRPLFVYVNTQALEENKAVAPFVDFYLDNLNAFVEQARYVTLPEGLAQESYKQWEDRTTGTVYTPQGEPKGGDLETALRQSQ
jgi:phosphate transport system substrate-binding protein